MKLPAISLPKVETGFDFTKFANLISSIGAIGVSVIIVFFVAWPKFTEVLNLRSENKQLEEKVKSLNTKADLLSSLDKNELDLQLVAAEQVLPSDKGVFSLVSQIERAAADSGVLLNKMDLAPGLISGAGVGEAGALQQPKPAGQQADIAPKIQLKIALTSDYRSFLNFVNNLLVFSRVVSIGDMSLSSSAGSGGPSQIRTSLAIDGYWQPLPAQLGSVESPVEQLNDQEEDLLADVIIEVVEVVPLEPSAPAEPIVTGKSDIFAPF